MQRSKQTPSSLRCNFPNGLRITDYGLRSTPHGKSFGRKMAMTMTMTTPIRKRWHQWHQWTYRNDCSRVSMIDRLHLVAHIDFSPFRDSIIIIAFEVRGRSVGVKGRSSAPSQWASPPTFRSRHCQSCLQLLPGWNVSSTNLNLGLCCLESFASHARTERA